MTMNYYHNEAWDEFYRQTDPDKRKELYDSICESAHDDGANELRRELIENRYNDPKKPGKKVDKSVWQLMIIPSLDHGIINIRSKNAKTFRDCLKALGVADIDPDNETSVGAVYWEIRNAAARYFESCKGPNYARQLFGLRPGTDEEKLKRTAYDIKTMAQAVPKKLKMTEEAQIFSDAVIDEFRAVSEEAAQIFDELIDM